MRPALSDPVFANVPLWLWLGCLQNQRCETRGWQQCHVSDSNALTLLTLDPLRIPCGSNGEVETLRFAEGWGSKLFVQCQLGPKIVVSVRREMTKRDAKNGDVPHDKHWLSKWYPYISKKNMANSKKGKMMETYHPSMQPMQSLFWVHPTDTCTKTLEHQPCCGKIGRTVFCRLLW